MDLTKYLKYYLHFRYILICKLYITIITIREIENITFRFISLFYSCLNIKV